MAVQGLWTVGGINLPDFGISENPLVQKIWPSAAGVGNSAAYNTDPITGQQKLIAQPLTQGPPYSGPQPTPQPQSPWTTAPTSQPSGQGDSELTQLLKIAQGGQLNPSQKSRLAELLGMQQPQVPSGPSDADLNAIYQPGFNSLQQQEKLLREQLPGAEQSIESQYGLASKEMEANRMAQEAALGRQETGVSTSKANALAEARRLYNELSQNYAARFGSRSSAGPFAMELLGRETQRQFGNVETGATAATQAIADERSRVMDYINTQKEQFSLKKNDALREIKTTFANKLAEIGSARNALESDRAARRVQALTDARNMATQIQSAENEFNQKIYMFQLEQDATLKNKAAAASGYDTKYLDATKKVGDILTSYGPQAAESAAKQAGVNYQTFAPGAGYEWYLDPASGTYKQRKVEQPSTGFKFPWQ